MSIIWLIVDMSKLLTQEQQPHPLCRMVQSIPEAGEGASAGAKHQLCRVRHRNFLTFLPLSIPKFLQTSDFL